MADPLDEEDVRTRVQHAIDATIAHQREVLSELGPEADDLLEVITALLAGGKRLRAAFAYWGLRAGGQPDSDPAIRLATAMEFFQAAALIHDDVMDDSDTRRGRPSAHRALQSRHVERGWCGDSVRFGVSGAILAGDLCLNWTEELFSTCGLPMEDLARARVMFDRMRTQLMAGQYLDVIESVRSWTGVPLAEQMTRAQRVIRYKSAKYTIEHPLLIGAHAGGVDETDLAHLSDYGLALGHAFQLRDDLLGVFGDPEATGKPAGDDLREGKRTVLVAQTLAKSDEAGQNRMRTLLGRRDLDDDDIDELRSIIDRAGAVAAVEDQIDELTDRARAALSLASGIEPRAAAVLADLIETSTARTT